VTSGPNTTNGPMTLSLPMRVSALKNTVSGAVKVTPAAIAAWRKRCCIAASAWASSARLLTPWNSAAGASIAAQPRPRARASAMMSVR